MAEEVEKWKPIDAKPVHENNHRSRKFGLVVLLLIIAAFAAGFLPMWWKARTTEKQMSAQKGMVRDYRLLALLGSAAVDSRRGDYEPARRAASEFFTYLSSPESASISAPRDQVDAISRQRDELITLLARSDPAAAERISNLYVAFRASLGLEMGQPTARVAPVAPVIPPADSPPEPIETNSASSTNNGI